MERPELDAHGRMHRSVEVSVGEEDEALGSVFVLRSIVMAVACKRLDNQQEQEK